MHTIPDRDRHKPTVEKALNSLTSEMVSISNVNNSNRATVVNVQKSHKQIIYIKSNAGNIIGNISNVGNTVSHVQQHTTISQCAQIIEREEWSFLLAFELFFFVFFVTYVYFRGSVSKCGNWIICESKTIYLLLFISFHTK